MEFFLASIVASLLKRWPLGTHQGDDRHEQLAYYLNEYTFKFNRRDSTHRGKFMSILENAVQIEPVTHEKTIRHVRGTNPTTKKIMWQPE